MNCLDTAWKLYAAELRSWLRRRLSQAQDADDLMQDVFMKALRQGNQFCSVQNARAWLFEVTRNTLADRLKLQREMVELPEDLVAAGGESDAVDELTACLPRVLSELSDLDREAITFCDLQGMSQADYATHAGLNLSAAKSRLQRARQRLKDRMTTACKVRIDTTGHVEDFVPRPPLDAPHSGPG
ncbi:sigma-70 family RNA polymerase sigma factor [Rhodoferax sp.]|uniref:sigma-70 family RNA polymerase sigma factor n=1 Tax=Rhodoferax sp. TaxID=50421 RepID=UPI0025ED0ED3|nr:sigma-70 family RNA polymerase sigma factor [Rhodoferax sp.]